METATVQVSSQPSWTHFLIYMLIVAMVGGGAYYGGYKSGQLAGALKAYKNTPPTVVNGPATFDQSVKKAGYMFGLHLGKMWGLGVCHD